MLRVGRRTGAAAVASLIAITVSLASAQWPQTCVPGNAWNATKCPAGATCCHDQFSVSTMGCCPWANAVCCPLDGCCPSGTKCVVAYESSFNTVYNCTAPDGTVVGLDRGVCKPGVMLPLDAVKKNVIVIGDSLSIGYLPSLRAALADIALVQHAPADTSDGGAEETAYGVQCLDYWLHSPSGLDLGDGPDLITFNWGMHNYRNNPPIPGQEGNAVVYPAELQNITTRLLAYAAAHPKTKLLYLLTTPRLCTTDDQVIHTVLNVAAGKIMAAAGIPVLDPYTAIRAKCGGTPPTKGCESEPAWGADCWCPHCPPGYSWLTNSTLAAPIRAMLTGR